MEKFDLVIVGGGILGTSLSYWLSLLYEGNIALLEMEKDVAFHASGRNTGMIHRPFYLDPEGRKIFARSAQISFGLWKKYSELKKLPWQEKGTIEVAMNEKEFKVLEKYSKWAIKNGMREDEIELLDKEEVRKMEPNVTCFGALYSKTDTSVDYKAFTDSLKKDAISNGIQFIFGFKVEEVRLESNSIKIFSNKNSPPIETDFLVNCAGGNSIDIAHLFGVGLEYGDIHFRGEYWQIVENQSNLANRNIYSVPRHPEIPFLDPHWIVRANGQREIGPNAVLVSGSGTYHGFFTSFNEFFSKIVERPIKNKLKLMINPEFLKLALEEWMSSISKRKMVKRVQRFIPKLKAEHLSKRGTAGIRSSVIDAGGSFVKESIELSGNLSYHIINYNSPGATGAPAYALFLANQLKKNGSIAHLKERKIAKKSFWDPAEVLDQFQ